MTQRAMRLATAVCVLASFSALAACGGGDGGSPPKGDSSDGSSSAPAGPGGMPTEAQMQQQADETRRALAEMSGGKEIKAVDPKEMKALLHETLGGAKRNNAESSRMSQGGIDIATARANYDPEATEGDTPNPSFSVEIMDLGNLSGAMAVGFTSWAMTQFERDTETGYEKTTKYKDHPAVEKYDRESKSGELQVYVAKRFLVKVSGNDATIEQIREAVDALDVGKVASLAK
jgi:hypothetical protein